MKIIVTTNDDQKIGEIKVDLTEEALFHPLDRQSWHENEFCTLISDAIYVEKLQRKNKDE